MMILICSYYLIFMHSILLTLFIFSMPLLFKYYVAQLKFKLPGSFIDDIYHNTSMEIFIIFIFGNNLVN